MAIRAIIIADSFVEDTDPSRVTVSVAGSILGPRPPGGPVFSCLAEGINPAAAVEQKTAAIQAAVKAYLIAERGVVFNANDTVDFFVPLA